MSGWLGGIHVHRMERGQVPICDLLCTACWWHRRVTGHRAIQDFLNSQPIEQHRDQCPAQQKEDR